MPDFEFGGLIDATGLFTWQSGGTNPGATINEASNGLPNVTTDQVYTYNGGSAEAVTVTDNDSEFIEGDLFQQTLTLPATINGVAYAAGTQITTTGQIVFRDNATGTAYTVYTGTLGTNSAGVTSPTYFYIWKDGAAPPAGSSLRVVSRGQPTSITYNTLPAPCFCNGTLIQTPDGPRRVEDLTVGDLVNTRSGPPLPVRWIGSQTVTPEALAAIPELRPVILTAGSLGHNVPTDDLMVSRQHRVRLASHIVAELTEAEHVLVPAVKLVGVPGVHFYEGGSPFTYYHLLLDRHSLVQSNGTWTESLYLGREFLGSLSTEARDELRTIFPKLLCDGFDYPPVAPMIERRRVIDELVRSHLSSHVDLA
ncbi:Hint domain-containing protein [Paracoccus marinaquae]|uniref:Hint domain-containing protein n=1 Tax=Paracoccus marinaquae TaxID=2841926 RepID=A0ABS6AJH1_9RHOB|nr:Hint domain-containing protein [Paracoccus marinaquae]MBU3030736.1 Hint domain-containing protein [Paracoccus marinaquae]